eukprot:350017-Pyramimonas_sp.AAC.1
MLVFGNSKGPASLVPGKVCRWGKVKSSTRVPFLQKGPELRLVHMHPSGWHPVGPVLWRPTHDLRI